MTFIISYISENGISMASDSNVTIVKGNKYYIRTEEITKTDYFKENLGISIWGKLEIGKKEIWEYIKDSLKEFFEIYQQKEELPSYLTEKLNNSMPAEEILKIDQIKRYTRRLGIHLSMYLKIDENTVPVLYHITNNRNSWKFEAQPDIHPSNNSPPYMVFNGFYKPFSSAKKHFIDYLTKTSNEFSKIIIKKPEIQKKNLTREYNLEKELKLLITTIKQYQAILELKGLKPIVGGKIEGICFNEGGLIKRLKLNEV